MSLALLVLNSLCDVSCNSVARVDTALYRMQLCRSRCLCLIIFVMCHATVLLVLSARLLSRNILIFVESSGVSHAAVLLVFSRLLRSIQWLLTACVESSCV